jgi:GT2 family glycosyltransferase
MRYRRRRQLLPGGAGVPQSVSVVICTYQREESLRNLLIDLVAQRVLPNEIIVVDQTPEHEPATEALLRNLAPLVRHDRQREPNLPAARNRGTRLAQGDVVLFVDDDVRLSPIFLVEVYNMFRTAAVDALAPLVTVDGVRPGMDKARRYSLRRQWTDRPVIVVDSAIGACMAIRREAINAVGGFDETLAHLHPSAAGEDLEFTRRLTRAGFVLVLTPGIQVTHELDRPGGCRNREVGDTSVSRRALAYIALKESHAFDRLSPTAVARLCRIYFIRRDVVFSRSRLLESWRALASDLPVVRGVAAHGVRPVAWPNARTPR